MDIKMHMEWSMAGKKNKNKHDFTNMPHPALKNTGDRRADRRLQASSCFDSFPTEAVTKEETCSELRDRLGFTVLSSQSSDNVTQLLSGMDEMYSCFRGTETAPH